VQEITITAAAEHLQVSTATVKRRLRKGTLKGRQIPRPQGYTWLIEVDQDQDTTPPTTTADAALIRTLHDQVQAQGEELEARRREVQQLLATHHEEIRELHTLLAQQTALNTGRRPWWRFW